eukprot:CAMPEP_0194195102 /NCGR_PEP_ID=MMETSP0154-20130528/75945_1 /TAXON_ID=1049557 /ORGANISM="Thalassiothrix antarctica, Strain L6-D1" /LENGTH=496 /DNA_ID=CAMNT_0038919589 /DNA_START=22 /DNA_END=1509 /DNA_ORIENTATION=-
MKMSTNNIASSSSPSLTKLVAAAADSPTTIATTKCGMFRRRIRNTIFLPLLLLLPFSSYFHWHQRVLNSTDFIEAENNDILRTSHNSLVFGFHKEWHPLSREERFPSTTQRIQLYMSNFYLPPCNVEDKVQYSYIFSDKKDQYPVVRLSQKNFTANITTHIDHDMALALWEESIQSPCDYPHFENNYCDDLRKMASTALRITLKQTLRDLPPIIAQLGDHLESDMHKESVPIILKFRAAATSQDALKRANGGEKNCIDAAIRPKLVTSSKKVEYSPIIWPLNYYRHYGSIDYVQWFDSPWEWKNNRAVWRGLLTGLLSEEEKRKAKTFSEQCELVPRCRFVQQQIASTEKEEESLLDVGVSDQLEDFPIDNAHLYYIKGDMSKFSQLQYKAIIIMEGNDISTGLKWALYSRSVVMMPPPTKTSFLMEERLQPYVHYVPLQPDMSDASQQMQWIIDNDDEARRIAERATLWIHDLLYHKDSKEDNQYIQEQILQRYM